MPRPSELPRTRRRIWELTRLRKHEGDLIGSCRRVTETAARILKVEQVSVWLFDEGRTAVECIDLFDARASQHSAGQVLSAVTFPTYFAALQHEAAVVASDAFSDPRTVELRDSYLEPLDVRSLLDVPIFVEGEMVGIVCHESIGKKRNWELWEELAVQTFADHVALALLADEQRRTESQLQDIRIQLERTIDERTHALHFAHERLSESEADLRSLFAAWPMPLVLSRVNDGTLVMANDRAREVVGVEPDYGARIPMSRFWKTEEARARMRSILSTVGRIDNFECELMGATGPIWVLLNARVCKFQGETCIIAGFQTIDNQKREREELRELATRDPLTGVANRRAFFELSEHEVRRAHRYSRPLAVAMIDVDHFKRVNDEHGHAVGDEVLAELARRTASVLRKADVFARYGGEEFVVLLPELRVSDAMQAMERLRTAITATPFRIGELALAVSVSIGLAALDGGDESIDPAVERADAALYEAKSSGRDRVEVSAPPRYMSGTLRTPVGRGSKSSSDGGGTK